MGALVRGGRNNFLFQSDNAFLVPLGSEHNGWPIATDCGRNGKVIFMAQNYLLHMHCEIYARTSRTPFNKFMGSTLKMSFYRSNQAGRSEGILQGICSHACGSDGDE